MSSVSFVSCLRSFMIAGMSLCQQHTCVTFITRYNYSYELHYKNAVLLQGNCAMSAVICPPPHFYSTWNFGMICLEQINTSLLPSRQKPYANFHAIIFKTSKLYDQCRRRTNGQMTYTAVLCSASHSETFNNSPLYYY